MEEKTGEERERESSEGWWRQKRGERVYVSIWCWQRLQGVSQRPPVNSNTWCVCVCVPALVCRDCIFTVYWLTKGNCAHDVSSWVFCNIYEFNKQQLTFSKIRLLSCQPVSWWGYTFLPGVKQVSSWDPFKDPIWLTEKCRMKQGWSSHKFFGLTKCSLDRRVCVCVFRSHDWRCHGPRSHTPTQ